MSKKMNHEVLIDSTVDWIIAEADRFECCANEKNGNAYTYRNAMEALRKAFELAARMQGRPSRFQRAIRSGVHDDSLLAMIAE